MTSCAAQTLQDELERLVPPSDPLLAEADKLLSDFASYWDLETAPVERHRLLTTNFEQAW